ncbi:LysR family transcriptional regulator [Rhizobium sp. CSW-27]|uniref:LysR substrate-binding domain-containing protein n=1 Tax=Rhizobium sp. CSW-27 TaxID=2839985 RepID=UPI001C018E2F|nr:LysR family transcriptional regulator [Rhizobium sp. CSW-27]MBT9373234.1 LysR family transcriptional regulator [Rhizobium sp. CSW-27]
MLDQFSHLVRFNAVVEEGSLRKAAERLSVTQPALSRSIAILEADFGRPLLERHARGVRMTPFGERVMQASLRMLRGWEIAEAELRAGAVDRTVVFRIGLGPSWRTGILSPALEAMRKLHPNVLIEILPLNEPTVLDDLAEGRLDVAFAGNRIDPRAHPNLIRRDLTDIEIHVTAREGHPVFEQLRYGDQSSEQVLLDYPWIAFTGMAIFWDSGDYSMTKRLGREPEVWVSSSCLTTVLSLLQTTDSLSVLSNLAVKTVQGRRLVKVPVAMRQRSISLAMIFRAELAGWGVLEDFSQLCMEHLTDHTLVEQAKMPAF